MEITSVVGSPRSNGSCARVARAMVDALAEKTTSVRTYELNKLRYRGCQGCWACKNGSETCVTQDDLSPVLDALMQSDVVVVSTPVYVGESTAQFKGLVDRLFSFTPPDFKTNPTATRLPPGKKLVLIVSQGNPDEQAFGNVVERYETLFHRLGFEEVYPIRVCGAEDRSVLGLSKETVDLVNDAAAKILAGA